MGNRKTYALYTRMRLTIFHVATSSLNGLLIDDAPLQKGRICVLFAWGVTSLETVQLVVTALNVALDTMISYIRRPRKTLECFQAMLPSVTVPSSVLWTE